MSTWYPWNTLESLRREIDRTFEDFGTRTNPRLRSVFLPGREARGYPLLNLYEDSEALRIEALAPGLEPADIHITVLNNVLTIGGEKRRLPADVKPEALHRSERATGRFVRSIALPVEVDVDNVQADYTHGLLNITLPKAERAKPQQITVKTT
jgi:HSP20 family protein